MATTVCHCCWPPSFLFILHALHVNNSPIRSRVVRRALIVNYTFLFACACPPPAVDAAQCYLHQKEPGYCCRGMSQQALTHDEWLQPACGVPRVGVMMAAEERRDGLRRERVGDRALPRRTQSHLLCVSWPLGVCFREGKAGIGSDDICCFAVQSCVWARS